MDLVFISKVVKTTLKSQDCECHLLSDFLLITSSDLLCDRTIRDFNTPVSYLSLRQKYQYTVVTPIYSACTPEKRLITANCSLNKLVDDV